MKLLLSISIAAAAASISNAQPKYIVKAETAIQSAVSKTNAAFPVVFLVTVSEFRNGKVVSTETSVNERQGPGIERSTRTRKENNRTTRKYKVSTGFGSVYCSDDGINWTGPQKVECWGPSRVSGPRTPENIESSVVEKRLDGKDVKVYREYSLFASKDRPGIRDFRERFSTIDSQGFLVEMIDTEGSLDPKMKKVVTKQTWTTKKFAPVVAPIAEISPSSVR